MTEKVTVPKALLAEVLETAEGDSYTAESEFCCSESGHEQYKAERAKIRELRRIADIPDNEEVTGQGFFGIALAVKERLRSGD